MEEAFDKLQKDGKNNVDNLVTWMKNSNVIENSQAAEQKAREMFASVADKNNVELGKFKEVLGKLANEQKKSVDDFTKVLSEKGPEMLSSALAGMAGAANAFAGALTGKK